MQHDEIHSGLTNRMTITRHVTAWNQQAYQVLSSRPVARNIAIAILVVLIAGTLYFLQHRSLWLDEFWSISLARPHWPFAKAFAESIATDAQPPFYYSLQHFWISWFGDSRIAVRSANLPGFAILIGAMVYSWRMRITRPVWLLFWCLVLTSRFIWDFATEARSYFYTLCNASLLAVVTYNMALSIAAKTPIGRATYVVFALSALFASALHFFGYVLAGATIAALFLYALVEKEYRKAGALAGIGAGVLAAQVAWLAYSAPKLWFDPSGFWLTFQPILETRYFISWTFSTNVIVLALVAVASLMGFTRLIKNRPFLLLVAAFVLSYLAIIAISLKYPMLFHRYLIAFAPLLMLIATLALFEGLPKAGLVPALVSILLISLPFTVAKSMTHREDWEGATAWIGDTYGAQCDKVRFMSVGRYKRSVAIEYLANGRDWDTVGYDPAGYAEALATDCPVIGWVRTENLADARQKLAALDLQGRTVELQSFAGFNLFVTSKAQ